MDNHDLSFLSAYKETRPWLEQNTLFLTVHGSHCYGTNIASSDWDYKGFCCPPKEYFLGFNNTFEQADGFKEHTGIDCVVYDIRKFFKLAANCNPNILEVLYTNPSDHVIKTPLAQKIIDNRHLFLSKKARHSFSGYAFAQIKRMNQHYELHNHPPDHKPTREEFELPNETLISKDQLGAAQAIIQKQLDGWNPNFSMLSEPDRIEVQNKITEVLVEICGASLYLEKNKLWEHAAVSVGISKNFLDAIKKERAYKNALLRWQHYEEWKANRNKERAALEAAFGVDVKHAYHLVRLLRMCEEILRDGEVIVKRPDAKELLEIRNGAWSYEKIVKWATEQDAKMTELYKTSQLPYEPDRAQLDAFCREIIEEFLGMK